MARIIIRNSAAAGNTPTTLVQGEIALNVTDGKLFYGSGSSNTVKELQTGGGSINTGSLLTTASFNAYTGSNTSTLAGTASYALTAQTLLGSIESASYATTASYALVAQTLLGSVESASYAATASYVNPLRQNVLITGSFNVSGSTTQIGNNNLLGQTNLSGSIIVSGTMQANANVTIGGTLRLDPAQDPGNTNATASFLFTSASNTTQGYDLYYRQDGNLAKFKWLEGGISTGLLYGGVVSGSGTTIYVGSGSGIVMNSNASFSQEINPQFTYITWNSYSASAAYLTSSQNTYIYVDDTGVVRQQSSYFTETQYQEAICLGRVTHANYTNITGVGSNVQTTYDSDAQQSEFIRAFGPLKVSGLTVSGQTGTLNVNIGAGTAYNLGGFYSTNVDHPSSYTSTATVTGSIARAYRSGSSIYLDNNGGAFYTDLDPTKYDDGSGVLQNTGNGNYTIQRVFYNPQSKRSTIYYGQERYTTLLNALQYLPTDPFTEGEFTAKSLVFVAYLVLKGNTTDLTNTTQNSIVQAGLFRNTTGGSGAAGSVTLTLENLSDVNITGVTNGQSLIYNSGTWVNGVAASASYSATASFLDSTTNAFVQGGNSFGTTALLGTNDNQSLALETSGSTRMFISSSGNVGIGTSTPFSGGTSLPVGLDIGIWNSAGDEGNLSVRGFSSLGGTTRSSYGAVGSNYYMDTSGAIKRRFADSVSLIDFSAGGFLFRNAGNAAINSSISLTELMRITSTGNVGIATTTPAAKLDVSGSVNISGSGVQVPFQITSGSISLMYISSSGRLAFGTSAPTYAFQFSSSAGTDSLAVTNGSNFIRISSNLGSGNPGIQSSGVLHIGAPINGTGGTEILQVRKSSGGNFIQYWANNAGTNLSAIDGNGSLGIGTGTAPLSASLHISGASSANLLRIDSPASSGILFVSGSGNIGIGTATPDSYYAKKLVISAVDESGVTLAGTTTSATNYLAFADGTTGNQAYRGYVAYKHLTDQLAFGSGGTLRATIDNAGNLGIGTSTISARLHAVGSGATSATTALRVENTNASASLVVLDNGFVGIGTSTPSSSLHIASPGNASTDISFKIRNRADTIDFLTVDGVGRVTQTSPYQVGGTTVLYTSDTATNDYGPVLTFAGNYSGTTSVPFGIIRGAKSSVGGQRGYMSFHTGPSGASLSTESMRIDWNNNVGIGHTVPSARLHVSGASTAALFQIDSPASSSILFVSGSGRVGLGTNNPTSTLHISSSATGQALRLGGTGANYIDFLVDNRSAIGWNGSSGLLYLSGRGNGLFIGEAATDASARLQVRGTGATSATTTLLLQNSSLTDLLTVRDDGSSTLIGRLNITPTTSTTSSLVVTGPTLLSGSQNTISGSVLTVVGSGSAQPIFTVQGSQGELFSVVDSLSGSLFSVNDISGLPIMEVFSDGTTLMGNYLDPMLVTTAKNVLTNSGSFTVYSLPTASYDTAFFDYSARSGSNARAGQIMAIQSGSSVNYTETTTMDFGSTTGLSLGVFVSGSNMVLTGSADTTAWTIKTIIRSI